MLKVALTGGIATGKTSVLARFGRLGVPTIDADRLAHETVRPGSAAWRSVRERFGPGVLAPTGELDRQKLATVVFADPGARRDLEGIIHPVVYQAIIHWFGELAARGDHRLGVADIPLLYETGRTADFDRVIVAACEPDTQVRRVVARDGITDVQARQRLAAQWPIAEKVSRADFVIRTDGLQPETDRQVDEIYRELVGAG